MEENIPLSKDEVYMPFSPMTKYLSRLKRYRYQALGGVSSFLLGRNL